MIVKRLEKHVFAEPEIEDGVVITKSLMTQSQVTAALGLIKKTLPDLSAVDSRVEVVNKDASELTDAELTAIVTAGSTGTVKQANSKKVTH